MKITKEYLRTHPRHVFVYGDNNLHVGHGGAAILRDEPNTYGFITKKHPSNNPESFYKPEEYREVYKREIKWLIRTIIDNPSKTFLISQVGAGLANAHRIWEIVISPHIKEDLGALPNVKFLW